MAFFTRRQQDRPHTGRDAYRRGVYRRLHHLHGVINGHAGVDRASRAVDVHIDGLGTVLAVQVQQLGDNEVGHLVVHPGAQKDNALLEQKAVNVVGPLGPIARVDDHGHDGGSAIEDSHSKVVYIDRFGKK